MPVNFAGIRNEAAQVLDLANFAGMSVSNQNLMLALLDAEYIDAFDAQDQADSARLKASRRLAAISGQIAALKKLRRAH